MSGRPDLVLHEVPQSHPCLAVTTALEHFGLAYESVMLISGQHGDEIEKIYGEGRRTVPAMLVDGKPVHGTVKIFQRIDQLVDGSELFPPSIAEAIREAERGLAQDLQSVARRLTFGALHFRPEALGTFGGGEALDPAGVDFAIGMVRGAWRYIGITAVGIAEDLERLPDLLDRSERLLAEGVIGGKQPNAADFEIGASLHLLARIGDIRDLLAPELLARTVEAWFRPGVGFVPRGALPPGWVPAPAGGS